MSFLSVLIHHEDVWVTWKWSQKQNPIKRNIFLSVSEPMTTAYVGMYSTLKNCESIGLLLRGLCCQFWLLPCMWSLLFYVNMIFDLILYIDMNFNSLISCIGIAVCNFGTRITVYEWHYKSQRHSIPNPVLHLPGLKFINSIVYGDFVALSFINYLPNSKHTHTNINFFFLQPPK